jgi:hypothetical protein
MNERQQRPSAHQQWTSQLSVEIFPLTTARADFQDIFCAFYKLDI